MAPKSKKQQSADADAEKDVIRNGPQLNWLRRDPCTHPLVPCPSPRCYTNAAVCDGRLYAFGGWNGMTRIQAMKKAEEQQRQQQQQQSGDGASFQSLGGTPPRAPSYEHGNQQQTPRSADKVKSPGKTMHRNTVVMLNSPNPAHCHDVLMFDFNNGVWQTVEDISGEPHPGTSQAAAAELGGALLFFGGWDGYRRHNTLTLYSLQEGRWKPFPTVGDVTPPAVTFHAVCGYGRRFFVFGGDTADGLLADMYILDLTTTTWNMAPNLGAPAKRSSHTMTVLQGLYVVVIGGRNADGVALNEVAVFDITHNHWVIGVKVSGVGPARYGHSAVAVTDDKILVYGGVGPKVGTPSVPPQQPSPAGRERGEKGSDAKDKADASAAAAIQNFIAGYEYHSDVWILTMEKPGQLSWTRASLAVSDSSGTGAVSIFGGDNNNNNTTTAAPHGGQLLPSPPTPSPTSPTPPSAQAVTPIAAATPTAAPQQQPPQYNPKGRCGHSAVMHSSHVYVFGGRHDDIGGVTGEILALDVSPLLPPPSSPSEEATNRGESESAMRPSSSATTQ